MSRTRGTPLTRTIETAERDAEIARYCVHHTITAAAAHFGLNKSTISRARNRAIAEAVRPAGEEALGAELVKLDLYEAAVLEVLRANHVYVSDGRIIRDNDPDATPLLDYRPVLMAVDRGLRISERRARLLGLDAPTKQQIHVLTEDVVDAALREAAEEHARLTAPADPSRSLG